MFLSYLVTCHNEGSSLHTLLSKLCDSLKPNHEIVVVDDYSTCEETLATLQRFSEKIKVHKHKLDNHYGAHKNFGVEQCSGKWIFQLDADELPSDNLIRDIDLILEANDASEVLWVPRCNFFVGVTQQDINDWGWRMNKSQSKDMDMVNFPDYQSRIYKNQPHIRYKKRLHERVEGNKSYVFIPPQEEWSIIHNKTIEKQRESNHSYMKNFTMEENMGYPVN